jgi:hypothetical protein
MFILKMRVLLGCSGSGLQLLLLLFLLVILVVKLLNPSLDASQVERLVALLAVPQSTSLVNRIMTDYAFLGSLRQ